MGASSRRAAREVRLGGDGQVERSFCTRGWSRRRRSPHPSSTASSRRTFSGTSSTTRIRPARSLIGCLLRSSASRRPGDPRCSPASRGSVEALRQETLAVSLHRLRGHGEHRDGGRALVGTQPAKGLDAVHARHLDIHEHQSGACSIASSTASPPVVASSVRYPVALRMSRNSFMFFSLSSTTGPAHRSWRRRSRGQREDEGIPLPSSLSSQIVRRGVDETFRERESEPRPFERSSPASVCWNSSKTARDPRARCRARCRRRTPSPRR